jgi:pimeloyl-ACP methyl ester carboxylesterase
MDTEKEHHPLGRRGRLRRARLRTPLLLVHGTPTNSYIWRNVALRLADRFSVFTFDLLGFGQAERREGLDVSIPAQARLLAELVEALNLDAPSIAGHDIGGAIALRAHLLEGVPFGCIALIDSVAVRPWITPTTNHIREHLDVYETMPTETFEAVVASHLRTATYRPMDEHTLATYLDQWKGEVGQMLYLQNAAQLREEDTAGSSPCSPPSPSPFTSSGARTTSGSLPPSPNACTNSSPAPTSSFYPTQGTSPWKTAHKKSPQPSSISSPTAASPPRRTPARQAIW